jgi:predicted transcriptional regulator
MHNPDIERTLWYVFFGSRAGRTRIRIIDKLKEGPANIHQLSTSLGLHYRGVKLNMKMMEKNDLVNNDSRKYGTSYYISDYLQRNIKIYEEIKSKLLKQDDNE